MDHFAANLRELSPSESVHEVRNEALFISVGYRSGFLGHWAHEDLAKEVLMRFLSHLDSNHGIFIVSHGHTKIFSDLSEHRMARWQYDLSRLRTTR